jgi:hypothetical protein
MDLKNLFTLFIAALLLISFGEAQSSPYSDQDCLRCHGKPEISQILHDGNLRTLYVDPEKWSLDVHHLGKLTCVDCHTNANPFLHFREGFIDVDCARCHPIEEEEYQKNIHLTFTTITPGKELPLCYHCHTKHAVLRHDNPLSSIHESNIGETCMTCHPEIMVNGILDGTSLGKISGHRKGDIAEKFDMNVCIDCHYKDSAHGTKRVYKDFCTRCHDVGSKGNLVMGPTHLDGFRWTGLNYIGNGLLFLLLLAMGTLLVFKSRKKIVSGLSSWHETMKTPVVSEESDTQATQTTIKQENNENG